MQVSKSKSDASRASRVAEMQLAHSGFCIPSSLQPVGTLHKASSQRAADLGTDSRTSADSRGSGSSASSEIMPAIPTAGSGAPYLRSRLKGLNIEEARAIRRRLRVRLGAITQTKLVSGKSLHDAVSALGLTRYGLQEINDIVNCLADFIGLRFLAPDHKVHRSSFGDAFLMS